MKKGFELLKSRGKEDRADFSLLEEKGILLPPLYRIFFSCFKSNSFMDLYRIEKEAENGNFKSFLTSLKSVKDYPIITDLYSEKQIVNLNTNHVIAFHGSNENFGFIGVAELPANETLLVGINAKNEDVLFKYRFNDRTSTDPAFEKIADNIFSYINSLEEVEYDIIDKDKSLYYKNWGEDFWQVREDTV